MTTYWPLLGVAVVVAGFAARRNPVLVVVVAGLVSGLAAGKSPGELLTLLGTTFVTKRTLLLFALTLPVIGVLERAGLRERAATWILGFARLTLTGLLMAYMTLRQLLAMVGLIYVAGHAQTVRPLLAPMSEATATRAHGPLDPPARDRLRGFAAATDNVGVFFGEDVFLAFGAVILIHDFYAGHGIQVSATAVGLCALPTAIAAFMIHGTRIALFHRTLARGLAARHMAGPASGAAHADGGAPGEER